MTIIDFLTKSQYPSPILVVFGVTLGPRNGPKIDKKPFFSSLFPMRFFIAKSCENVRKSADFGRFWVVRRAIWICKTQVQMHFCIFRHFLDFWRILLHFEQIFDHFDLFWGPKITENREKWGHRIEVENRSLKKWPKRRPARSGKRSRDLILGADGPWEG